MQWKWRVYLPPDKKYRLHWTDYDIPADGKIKAENSGKNRSYGSAKEYSGEFLVEFSVYMGYEVGGPTVPKGLRYGLRN